MAMYYIDKHALLPNFDVQALMRIYCHTEAQSLRARAQVLLFEAASAAAKHRQEMLQTRAELLAVQLESSEVTRKLREVCKAAVATMRKRLDDT